MMVAQRELGDIDDQWAHSRRHRWGRLPSVPTSSTINGKRALDWSEMRQCCPKTLSKYTEKGHESQEKI
jgi:hypothetical protein